MDRGKKGDVQKIMKSIFYTEWSYDEAVKYIEEIPRFTEKHPLSHTKVFLREI